ncbi:helix-turn-helix domain-containing protein [Profundibacter sp.]
MSHAATNWAIKQRGLKPAAKIVLWHLADCHNGHTGQCNPRQVLLAEMCEMSQSTLNVHLAELEKRGLIKRHRNVDPSTKKRRATHYTLAMDDGETPQIPNSGNRTWPQDVDQPPQDVAEPTPESGDGISEKPTPDSGQSQLRNPELYKNLGIEPGICVSQGTTHMDFDFDDFADRFLAKHPRPGDREATEDALRRALEDGADPEQLIRAAEAYGREQAGNKPAFIAYSENWLRKGRWKAHLPKPKATEAEVAKSIAESIRAGKHWVATHVSDARARELVRLGLVSREECEAVGLSP